jgi:hypothetical protein
MSLVLPAGNGTTTVIGLLGKSAASAGKTARANNEAAHAEMTFFNFDVIDILLIIQSQLGVVADRVGVRPGNPGVT